MEDDNLSDVMSSGSKTMSSFNYSSREMFELIENELDFETLFGSVCMIIIYIFP